MFVGSETFDGHAEIGPERCFARVEAREKLALDCRGEKALGQVFGVFVVLSEFEADESIDRFPVERDHAIQRLVRHPGAGGLEQRKLGGREMAVWAADRGIGIQLMNSYSL